MESNIQRLLEDNQKLNEEKYFIMTAAMQNQNMSNSLNQNMSNSQTPSFIHSMDAINLQRAMHDKENISTFAFDEDESSVNIHHNKLPSKSRMHANQMSADQSQLIGSKLRMSQNLSTVQRNANLISNRVS
jgi:hypothetical protein